MAERQLRNHSVATGVEAAPLDSESCRNSTELDCNVVGGETLGNKGSFQLLYLSCLQRSDEVKFSVCTPWRNGSTHF
jgi:hypothetical protein